MSPRDFWIKTSLLFEDNLLEKIFFSETNGGVGDSQQVGGSVGGGEVGAAEVPGMAAVGSQDISRPLVKKRPVGKVLAPEPEEVPGKFPLIPKYGEIPHEEPSLAARTHPELPSPDKRLEELKRHYLNPEAKNKSLRKLSSDSLNATFLGNIGNAEGREGGYRYIVKPHEGAIAGDIDDLIDHPHGQNTIDAYRREAQISPRRHDAIYQLMSAMGAHHMAVPGIAANMHGLHQFTGTAPNEDDKLSTKLRNPVYHAGSPSHVQEFIDDSTTLRHATKEQLNSVDLEHRIHGIVGHLLSGSQDAHRKNILIHPKGYPVIIDHDYTFDTVHQHADPEGEDRESFMSEFAPGGKLNYQEKLPKDENGNPVLVGNNFPPRIKELLERITEGHFSKGKNKFDMSQDDLDVMERNAWMLLTHGLEGTIDKKYNVIAHKGAEMSS